MDGVLVVGRDANPIRQMVAGAIGPFAQSGERIRGKRGIAFRHFAYQFEKQRQRAWCAFMLQRTMLR